MDEENLNVVYMNTDNNRRDNREEIKFDEINIENDDDDSSFDFESNSKLLEEDIVNKK